MLENATLEEPTASDVGGCAVPEQTSLSDNLKVRRGSMGSFASNFQNVSWWFIPWKSIKSEIVEKMQEDTETNGLKPIIMDTLQH